MEKIKQRAEIPVEDTWAIEDLYPSDEAWEQDFSKLGAAKERLSSFAGRLADPKNLYDYLHTMEETDESIERLAHYCMRKADEDTRKSE